MEDGTDERRRLRFYGLSDYATYWQIEQAFQLLSSTPSDAGLAVNDVVELHHAAQYAQQSLFPQSATDADMSERQARVPDFRRIVGTFFTTLSDDNLDSRLGEVDYQYQADVLELMARNRAFSRCSAEKVLEILQDRRFHMSEMLACRALVSAYPAEIKGLLLGNPKHAERLIDKYLQADSRNEVNLPSGFTPTESRSLMDAYIDLEDANPNFLRLIATARVDVSTGIDARLKLKAKRKLEEWNRRFFETNEGTRTGCEVRILPNQDEPVLAELDDLVGKYSYSREWLEAHLDYPTVLNNFIYLFQFSNERMILNLPSYTASMGVFERHPFTLGRTSYRTSGWFDHTNASSLLQTVMYDHFLREHNVELEATLAWFFGEYLAEEFDAQNLKFRPSSPTASYLERCRHLFSEMESVLKQFALYVENGELDVELLSMVSEQLSYKQIPSLLEGKYVCAADDPDIQRVQRLVFSDQAAMGYIDDTLQAKNLFELLVKNDVPRSAFLAFQESEIDWLIEVGVIVDDGAKLRFASNRQLNVLMSLDRFEAASYYHYAHTTRAVIDTMVERGWLERHSFLLTPPEASYLNFQLNSSEFTNGPDLRNRYLHGSQADGEDEQVHQETYYSVLRMLVALVIKINDDFCLKADDEE